VGQWNGASGAENEREQGKNESKKRRENWTHRFPQRKKCRHFQGGGGGIGPASNDREKREGGLYNCNHKGQHREMRGKKKGKNKNASSHSSERVRKKEKIIT